MKKPLLLFLLSLPLSVLFSQNFNGGIIGGINASQISGDQLAGFNKAGINAGAFVNIYSDNYSSFQMELCFSQKGSKSVFKSTDTSASQRIIYRLRLNYIEMPLLYRYDLAGLQKHSADSARNIVSRMTFEAGLALASLISSSEYDILYNSDINSHPFNKYDFSVMLGFNYKISDMLNVNFRWSGSFIPVRKHSGNATFRLNRGQYNDVLTLSIHLQINRYRGNL